MTLSLNINKLDRKLRSELKDRNIQWAKEVCTACRFVNIDVWRQKPDSVYLRNNVIPLLELARNELLAMVNCSELSEEDKKVFIAELSNIELRVTNIEKNYLAGKRSSFAPDEKLSEPPTGES